MSFYFYDMEMGFYFIILQCRKHNTRKLFIRPQQKNFPHFDQKELCRVK